jgi:hypothetical protein
MTFFFEIVNIGPFMSYFGGTSVPEAVQSIEKIN